MHREFDKRCQKGNRQVPSHNHIRVSFHRLPAVSAFPFSLLSFLPLSLPSIHPMTVVTHSKREERVSLSSSLSYRLLPCLRLRPLPVSFRPLCRRTIDRTRKHKPAAFQQRPCRRAKDAPFRLTARLNRRNSLCISEASQPSTQLPFPSSLYRLSRLLFVSEKERQERHRVQPRLRAPNAHQKLAHGSAHCGKKRRPQQIRRRGRRRRTRGAALVCPRCPLLSLLSLLCRSTGTSQSPPNQRRHHLSALLGVQSFSSLCQRFRDLLGCRNRPMHFDGDDEATKFGERSVVLKSVDFVLCRCVDSLIDTEGFAGHFSSFLLLSLSLLHKFYPRVHSSLSFSFSFFNLTACSLFQLKRKTSILSAQSCILCSILPYQRSSEIKRVGSTGSGVRHRLR
mmetsp:Transcript_25531/g.49929  ORF Transcript_25531/g.49929 Transcript_25531/m.49929 type:complete len:395 (-) Transcript_25531:16-1200(-)